MGLYFADLLEKSEILELQRSLCKQKSKLAKIKKAGPDDPALKEKNCNELTSQEKGTVRPARLLLRKNHLPLTGIFAAGN